MLQWAGGQSPVDLWKSVAPTPRSADGGPSGDGRRPRGAYGPGVGVARVRDWERFAVVSVVLSGRARDSGRRFRARSRPRGASSLATTLRPGAGRRPGPRRRVSGARPPTVSDFPVLCGTDAVGSYVTRRRRPGPKERPPRVRCVCRRDSPWRPPPPGTAEDLRDAGASGRSKPLLVDEPQC